MFFCLLCCCQLIAAAQDGPLQEGSVRVNAGLGLGSFIKAAGGHTTFPPLTASVEYAIAEDMTVGVVAGYTSTEQSYQYFGGKDTYRFSHTLFGARANYYFDVNPKFEAYIGAFLGYDAVGIKNTYSNSGGFTNDYNVTGSEVLYGLQLGGRYKFSQRLAAFTELSYGISVLTVGFTATLGKK